MKPPVIIYHSDIPENAPADELDVLDQVNWFETGLSQLNYNVFTLPFRLDIDNIEKQLKETEPVFLVNLVETVRGEGRLIYTAPALFEYFRIPFTGCSSEAIYLTSNKIVAKRIMHSSGIATPPWIEADCDRTMSSNKGFLIKSVWEHASTGIDEHDFRLIQDSESALNELKNINTEKVSSFFAEQYIEGREFNISITGSPLMPRISSPAEIKFIDYPPEKPRIIGYRAKWDRNSFEYSNTIRSFEYSDQDKDLIANIENISLRIWHLFGLNGYARVDFRVDEEKTPWVLEVNANPCISADSGFVAAAEKSGMQHHEIARDIISNLA